MLSQPNFSIEHTRTLMPAAGHYLSASVLCQPQVNSFFELFAAGQHDLAAVRYHEMFEPSCLKKVQVLIRLAHHKADLGSQMTHKTWRKASGTICMLSTCKPHFRTHKSMPVHNFQSSCTGLPFRCRNCSRIRKASSSLRVHAVMTIMYNKLYSSRPYACFSSLAKRRDGK